MVININTPGATPKDTMSANESNCFPNSEVMLSFLATNPSAKSNTKAMNNNAMAISICPDEAQRMLNMPQRKFPEVIKFGRLNITYLNRFEGWRIYSKILYIYASK